MPKTRRPGPLLVILGLALSTSVSAGQPPTPAQGAVHELRDSHGRVVRRVVFRADGELQTTSYTYQATGLLASQEEHLDAGRRALRRVKESFDKDGRLSEREDVAAAEGGKLVGTRVRYRYDAAGRRSEERTAIE